MCSQLVGDYTFTKEVHSDTYPAIDPTKADHTGRSVFVVGATRGIGKAIALSFAKAGASNIVVGARSSLDNLAKAIRQAAKDAGRPEPTVLPVKIDITSRSSVEAAAQKVSSELGKLDVLVHNAGIFGDRGPIADTDPDNWWGVWEANVRGPYLVARSFIPLLLKSETKTLIAISSVGALITGATLGQYQAGKTAVTRIMDFAAADYKSQGLVAISVHPGNVLTDIVDRDATPPEILKLFTESPDVCADGLVYLTNEKRDWLSGRYINMTWDLPELTSSPKKDEIIEKDLLKLTLKI
jgi:NAD(P)-dependent dehydrogenase (short-subunit alcohol dehydrogenase family)